MNVFRALKRLPWKKVASVAGVALGVPLGFETTGVNDAIANSPAGDIVSDLEIWLVFVQAVAGAGIDMLRQRRAKRKRKAETVEALEEAMDRWRKAEGSPYQETADKERR